MTAVVISVLLAVVFLLFVLVDAFLGGVRRGLLGSITRILSILVCGFLAYLCAQYIGDHLMQIPAGNMTVGDRFGALVLSNPDLLEALDYSNTIEQLFWHFPEVLAKEILFVPAFALFRLVSLPIMEVINTLLFGGKKRREKSKKKPVKRALSKVSGVAIGVVQGVICFSLCLVPVFGVCDFGSAFVENFKTSEVKEIAEISVTVDEQFVSPINGSFITKTLECVGMRSMCDNVFHKLSRTKLEEKEIYYFDTLENALPAVSAFLLLKDLDPENMSSDDYKKLNNVFVAAKDSEEVSSALKEITDKLVAEYVEEDYRDSAEIITHTFVDYVLSQETKTDSVDLEIEIGAIENILSVMNTATTQGADSAFADKTADTVVDSLLQTTATYETLLSVVQDAEKCASMRQEIGEGDFDKTTTANELKSYRDTKLENASIEDAVRINNLIDAMAKLLDVSIDD